MSFCVRRKLSERYFRNYQRRCNRRENSSRYYATIYTRRRWRRKCKRLPGVHCYKNLTPYGSSYRSYCSNIVILQTHVSDYCRRGNQMNQLLVAMNRGCDRYGRSRILYQSAGVRSLSIWYYLTVRKWMNSLRRHSCKRNL